jgi:uncharacterized protein (TIGR00251 family)
VTAEAILLAVRVKPRSKRAGLLGWHGDALKVAVRAAPERGRANDELLGLLARSLALPAGAIELAAGATSQDKHLRITGLAATELRRRIDAALADVQGEG